MRWKPRCDHNRACLIVRYLVLSDIHGNWEALESVLQDAEGQYDEVVCCGDLVGYGADPDRVIEWVRANASAVVRGNHDKVAAGLESAQWFNPAARAAIEWTAAVLKPENAYYLLHLPRGPKSLSGFDILHGSPADEDEYLFSLSKEVALQWAGQPLAFFGHTHCQGGFRLCSGQVKHIQPVPHDRHSVRIALKPGCHYWINAGSVGQPRDGDPRAAYAIYDDTGQVELRRTPYPIAVAQAKIIRAGLPSILAERLLAGV